MKCSVIYIAYRDPYISYPQHINELIKYFKSLSIIDISITELEILWSNIMRNMEVSRVRLSWEISHRSVPIITWKLRLHSQDKNSQANTSTNMVISEQTKCHQITKMLLVWEKSEIICKQVIIKCNPVQLVACKLNQFSCASTSNIIKKTFIKTEQRQYVLRTMPCVVLAPVCYDEKRSGWNIS